jgi:hypothetical protein
MEEVNEETVGIIIELPVGWYELSVSMNYRLVGMWSWAIMSRR